MTPPDLQAPDLTGWQVLVTRPAAVADSLCIALEVAGADVHRAPVLAIEELPETAADRARAQDLDQFHAVIFTSRHAVQYGVPRLTQFWPQWPVGLRWLAVGAATAAALLPHGIVADAPADARSEGLLALPALTDIAGQRVLLVTGAGGRGLLERTLDERGARVARLAAYRRMADDRAQTVFDAFAARCAQDPQLAAHSAVLVTSTDALQNLLVLAPWLRTRSLLVITAGNRIAEAARTAGLARVQAATGADDQALVAALRTAAHRIAREDRA